MNIHLEKRMTVNHHGHLNQFSTTDVTCTNAYLCVQFTYMDTFERIEIKGNIKKRT